MRAAWSMLGLLAVCAGTSALAQVNKWVDEKGRVHYGDKPPASSAAGKGQAQNVPQAKGPQKAKPLPVQPKFHVPGDPLVERMRENEERRQNEQLTAECWKNGGANCNDSGTIYEMRQAEINKDCTGDQAQFARTPAVGFLQAQSQGGGLREALTASGRAGQGNNAA